MWSELGVQGKADQMARAMQRISEWTETVLAELLVCLMLAVVVQVAASALDLNPLVQMSGHAPLIGRAVTLNSLLDLQWHLLVFLGLIAAGLVWQRNAHVRVDFLYGRYSPAWKARLDLMGNLAFALPFFAPILPAAWSFMHRAWRSDEGSRNGGLEDLWLIKSVLPMGLAILAFYVALETFRLAKAAR